MTRTLLAGIGAAVVLVGILWLIDPAGVRDAAAPQEYTTFGTMGKEQRILQKDAEAELFRHEGRGVLTHKWLGGGHPTLGQTRLCTGQPLEEFALLDTPNRGVLYLVTMAARSTNLAYMEACIRAYIDGATEPRVGEELDGHVFFDPQPTTYWTYAWTYEW
jgi:hypothetical protein